MERGRIMNGEISVDEQVVTQIAEISFGRGHVGEKFPLTTDEAKTNFAAQLHSHEAPLTKTNTADCGDERPTVSLADGTTDPDVLRKRVAPQLFGGLGLATTKALVAANAAIVSDAENIWDAYLLVSNLLQQMGEEDGGHEGCGAAASVEASVANAINHELLLPGVSLFVGESAETDALLRKNTDTKQARLHAGFYAAWDPAKHVEHLTRNFPQNFSYLQGDPNDILTHGHNGSGIFVITNENVGFEKNAFAEDTAGQQAFAVTLPKMRELAYKLGVNDEERQRILIGFADDTLHVGAGIVTSGMPVFA